MCSTPFIRSPGEAHLFSPTSSSLESSLCQVSAWNISLLLITRIITRIASFYLITICSSAYVLCLEILFRMMINRLPSKSFDVHLWPTRRKSLFKWTVRTLRETFLNVCMHVVENESELKREIIMIYSFKCKVWMCLLLLFSGRFV